MLAFNDGSFYAQVHEHAQIVVSDGSSVPKCGMQSRMVKKLIRGLSSGDRSTWRRDSTRIQIASLCFS
jgi:hypothetical protein